MAECHGTFIAPGYIARRPCEKNCRRFVLPAADRKGP